MSTISEPAPSRKRRRGHGEGSIYFRDSDSRWVATVDFGYAEGKRSRKVVYGKTHATFSRSWTSCA
jgi:hypothetical protein